MSLTQVSLRTRLVTLTGLLSFFVALALIGVVQIVLAGNAADVSRQMLSDRANAVVRSVDSSSTSRGLSVPDRALGPGVVVYDNEGVAVAGVAPASLREEFAENATSTHQVEHRIKSDYAILARPFRTAAGPKGVVVLAEPLAPYEQDEHAALLVSIAAGLLIVLLATGAAAWISRRALEPVAVMARTAQEWSEQHLDRRFSLGEPTDEIRSLGRTLDVLLERVSQAIRGEQRLTSELAHELRTPLTTVSGIAELVAMRDDLDPQLREDIEDIQQACREMSSTMRVLMDLARDPAASTDGTCSGVELSSALADRYRNDPRLQLSLEGLRIRAPMSLAVRVLSPVIDNALQVADLVAVTATVEKERVAITIRDDGPGIPPELDGDLFEPGVSSRGSGLGLALARRVARSVGGDVTLTKRAGPGATFVVEFPGD